jgi:transcription elongation factor GreA
MPQSKYPMTHQTHKRLEKELHELKTVSRPDIIRAIAEARSHGDLSENAEYHAAKEKQGFIEAKIKDLEYKLSHSHLVDISKLSGENVQFGATVTLIDEETEEMVTYHLVSEFEADAAKKHISITSPVARALIGKKIGQSIEVATPKGHRYFEILKVEFLG